MIQRSVLMAKVIRKLIEKRNFRLNKMRSKRSPPDIPRDPNPGSITQLTPAILLNFRIFACELSHMTVT